VFAGVAFLEPAACRGTVPVICGLGSGHTEVVSNNDARVMEEDVIRFAENIWPISKPQKLCIAICIAHKSSR